MKAILISIRPEWVCKILNGEKTGELRKTVPKCELPVVVYIYCAKGKPNLWLPYDYEIDKANRPYLSDKPLFDIDDKMNGKVVAQFVLHKIERFINGMNELELEWDGKPDAEYDYYAYEKALVKACLTYEEADEYCPDQSFYVWHIEDLQIFDEPRELGEFGLKKAPQSWCYVEDKA